MYTRLLAAWEERGRRLPGDHSPAIRPGTGVTVTQLCALWWEHLRTLPYDDTHFAFLSLCIKRFREHFGSWAAVEVGPRALRDWRRVMAVDHLDAAIRRVQAVARMYRWGVSHELLPIEAYQRIKTLEPLRRTEPPANVQPAPIEAVEAVKAFVSRQVRTMIDLQLLTGMRPGEVCSLTARDIDMTDQVWRYVPRTHKSAWRGKRRTVYLGPRARALIEPFLAGRAIDAPLFSPIEAEAERRARQHAARKTPLKYGNRPGTNRKADPKWQPKECYTSDTYRRAITRACKKAGVATWHPHQLRHNAATEIRRQYGLEAARIMLGHSSALVTEAVYAERDEATVCKIAMEMG